MQEMRIIKPTEYEKDAWNGRLLVWDAPIRGEVYGLGVDPAEGVGADNSVCEVILLGNLKHPDIQVAEFACNYLDPIEFAEVVKIIGKWYADPDGTEAFCTVEINAPCGDVMVNDLYNRLDYGNLFIRKHYDKLSNIYTNLLGWSTNKATRPKIISRGIHAFSYGDLLVNSDHLLQEMQTFQRDMTLAKHKAMSGKHDDRLMALLIGYWGAHDEEFLSGEDVGADRRAEEAKRENSAAIQLEVKTTPTVRRGDFQSQPISYAKMMDRANELYFDGDD